MAKSTTNYFVCTLGEAAQDGIQRPFTNVNDLITKQAHDVPDLPAIGFFIPTEQSEVAAFSAKVLTFRDVYNGSLNAADLLRDVVGSPSGSTVALLAASSPQFLFTWLGCIRLGFQVLLIAPQCSAPATVHLCRSCEVSILLCDEKNEVLAGDARQASSASEGYELKVTTLPLNEDRDVFRLVEQERQQTIQDPKVSDDSIAYLHHTSGTSSGLPKPIPQSHHGAVGVLPALNGSHQATFTTTPLYHGGPADIFRAWTSNAMIWLFPSKDVPITAGNILRCLQAAEASSSIGESPAVKYFTSVPYVLQMMAADEEGLKWLQWMDLVGVGGAALPAKVGDELVKQGVNVVSRFGSAECGFLLSSDRSYATDKDWQYLRVHETSTQLKLEPREGGLFELVVGSEWPHMAKRNREDGSYATSDLFEKHTTIENGWRYHSRADSQMTLITGKKFDPAPIEHDLSAATDLVSDVLLFGNGKPYPGALLFKSKAAESMSDEDLLSKLAPVVEKLNEGNQGHARIPRNMLRVMPFSEEPLEKSSKGTIIRNKAEEKYADVIEQAYENVLGHASVEIAEADVPGAVFDLVTSVVGHDRLTVDDDLFAQGVDSVACVQIRHGLSQFLPQGTKALPLTVVEDSGTISALSDLTLRLRRGESSDTTDGKLQIPELINHWSKLDSSRPVDTMIDGVTMVIEPPGKTVLLTGATGSLGSHVLSELLQDESIFHVFVMVRGATPQAAHERVHKALTSRKLPVPDDFDQKVTILQCKLSEPDLGLPFLDYSMLQEQVDIVLHMAWSVNFLISLRSFTPHLAGIQNLLNLCLSSTKRKPPRFVFCSSVASVSNYASFSGDQQNVRELIEPNIATSGSTGYAQSKLTAELILAKVATTTSSLHNRITVVRVGQLSADTKHGIWSNSEAYPQILATAKLTKGMLPDLGEEERLTWLPVDVAAKAFVEAGLTDPDMIGEWPTEHVRHKLDQKQQTILQLKNGTAELSNQEIDYTAVKVLHLLNPDGGASFTDLLTRLADCSHQRREQHDISAGLRNLKIVAAEDWLQKLEQIAAEPNQSSEAQKSLRLLPFWKQVYSTRQASQPSSVTAANTTPHTGENAGSSKSNHDPLFDMHNSLMAMPALSYWLGLSTIEGRKSQAPQRSEETVEINGVDSTASAKATDRNELLKEEYILKVWQWVQDNVP